MNSVMVSGAKWTGKFTGSASWKTSGPVTVPKGVGGVAVQTVNCICTTPTAIPVNMMVTVTYRFSTKCKIDNKPVLESMKISGVLICTVKSGWSRSTRTVPVSVSITGDSKKVKDSAKWLTIRGADRCTKVTFSSSGQNKVNVD